MKTLLEKFVEMGGKVYEQTTAMDVEKGDSPQIITKEGHRITCEYVVSCSHFPFMMQIAFSLRVYMLNALMPLQLKRKQIIQVVCI